MAALESTKFVRFALPPSNPPFYRNSLWPAKPSRAIRPFTGSQKARRPAATLPRSGCQAEAHRSTAARADGRQRALADNDEESDDDLPSLEDLSRTALRRKISIEAPKTASTVQRLEPPALNGAGLQVDRTQSGSGERQGGSRNQPVILDKDDPDEAGAGDEAEGASGDVDTGHTERDASLHNTFPTSELASAPTQSIDTSGLWYDVEKGCYIEEPAPGLGPCEPHGVPSAPAQAQSSKPLQDQTNQQGVDDVTQSMLGESALHFLPKPSDSGNDGWTDENMAELEKELGLALEEEQVKSLFAGAPTSPSPRSVEAPQDEIQSRERSEPTGGRPEELRDASRRGTPAQDLEWWEKRETQVVVETLGRKELGVEELVGEAGGVEMQQHEEIAGRKEELGRPALGDQQNLAEVDDTDIPMDKEATEALPATQLEIDRHNFRLRRIRTKQLPERQTKTTQYRVVWGKHPNRSDSWVNEDDVQISMPRLPCERSSQDLVPPVERDVVRVHRMRCNRRSKGRKIFEYLVDELSTWVTEDQLRISLSPTLLAGLKASSTDPLSRAQSEARPKHPATPINDEHCHTPRTSRSPSSPSAPPGPARSGDPDAGKQVGKRGRQDVHTETSTHHSVNTDNNHNTCDTDDEDPRPAKRAKRRKSRVAPEIDDAQSQADDGCPSIFVDYSHHHASRTSRSPSVATEAAPFAEYREWPLECLLKCTKIGSETTYSLVFKLPSTSGHLHLPIDPKALDTNHNAAAHSQIHPAPLQVEKRSVKRKSTSAATCHPNFEAQYQVPSVRLQAKRTRVPWIEEENKVILEMVGRRCSWEEIDLAFQQRKIQRTLGAIKQQYYTKLK